MLSQAGALCVECLPRKPGVNRRLPRCASCGWTPLPRRPMRRS